MKMFKSVLFSLLMLIVMASFSQCSSANKLQKDAPVEFDQVYFQNWIAGVEGGGSGLNLIIPLSQVENKEMALDSVYFRGQGCQLEKKTLNDKTMYIGRFFSASNQKRDIIMSTDGNAEIGNQMPNIPTKIPFDLKENECVVSYKEGETIKYFKISNVIEKASPPIMYAPPNNN